jgi:hypothetical protein
MENQVYLLYWDLLDASELNVARIVEFLGGTINTVKLTSELSKSPKLLHGAIPNCKRLILSAKTLARLDGANAGLGEARQWLDLTPNVLVYDFESTQSDTEVLRRLTSGSFAGINALSTDRRKITVTANCPRVCRQFSGLGFDASGPDVQFAFVEGGAKSEWRPLASLGEAPFFVGLIDNNRQLLLLASNGIADLDKVVPQGTSILQFFSHLVPVLMFLRASSDRGFWHNDAPFACFIVDDPLLRERYGFLDYQRLSNVMEREHFCTSIAFIPWNCRRSDRGLAKRIAAPPHRYSLCVHGCDHTWGEFGSSSEQLLRERAQQALARMTLHHQLSGVAFDDVMVFPQGIFSTVAMRALKHCGYLAAVNTSPYPVDYSDGLKLRDLLQVAVTRFSDFPLFTRRPADKLAELAFDLFLGKPALIVAHHDFFRDGYNVLIEAVRSLHRMEKRLNWANLATICSQTCMTKAANNGEVQVQFLSDRFCLRNRTGKFQEYLLLRPTKPEEKINALNANGQALKTCTTPSCIKASISLPPRAQVEIRVDRGAPEPVGVCGKGAPLYRTKVFFRRRLTEFRDNYIATNRFLSGVA